MEWIWRVLKIIGISKISTLSIVLFLMAIAILVLGVCFIIAGTVFNKTRRSTKKNEMYIIEQTMLTHSTENIGLTRTLQL